VVKIRTAVILGMHSSIEKVLEGRGSLERIIHYPTMEMFAREGRVLFFTCDRKNYQHLMPDNCRHVPLVSKFIYIFLGWLITAIYCRKYKIDYTYNIDGSSLFAMPFFKWMTNTKLIHYSPCLLHTAVHSESSTKQLKEWLYLRFERYIYSRLDYIIICSSEIYKFTMSTNFRGTVIPLKKSIVINPNFHTNHKTKRVVWVGRLEDVKNPIFAILSWIYGGVYKEHPDATLTIIGDGSLYSTCKAMASVHEEANIRVVGQQHNVHKWLAESTVFISTSCYEATGDAILEAMSVGLPVVALDTGGVKNIVQDGSTGYLVDNDNYMSFAEPVKKLLSSRKLRKSMGNQAREQVYTYYEVYGNILRLIDFLKQEESGWV